MEELRLQKRLEAREKVGIVEIGMTQQDIEKEKQQQLLLELAGGYRDEQYIIVISRVSKADPTPAVSIDLKKLDEEDHVLVQNKI